jgi:hypothetical protein
MLQVARHFGTVDAQRLGVVKLQAGLFARVDDHAAEYSTSFHWPHGRIRG